MKPDDGWRLLLAARGGISHEEHVLAAKDEWILEFSQGRCVVVRPTRFWTLWRRGQHELVNLNLSIARLRNVASPQETGRTIREIEDNDVFVEALREYLASLPKKEFEETAALISSRVGVPRSIRVQVRSIPFADAMSLVDAGEKMEERLGLGEG